MNSSFPERLKALRLRRGVSRLVLGELCGLSKNVIGRYERGEALPSLPSLLALADYFEVSADSLLGRQAVS